MQKGFRISLSDTPVPTQLYKEKYNKVTNTVESAEYYLHTAAGQELAVLDLMQAGIYPMTLYAFGREREAKFETYYNTPSALGGDPDLPTEQRAASTCYGNGPAQFPQSLYRISDSDGRETYLFHSELPQPKPADWTLLQSLRAASADQRFFATFAEGKEAAAASIADILAWRASGLDFYLDGYDPTCPMRTDTIDPFFTIPIPDPSFYIYDHLGNTRIVYHTDDMGAGCGYSYVVETLLDYYPYGKTLRSYSLTDPERYVTTQHERDEETGYDYRGARYYDPDLFVFLSVDPMAEKYANMSPYVYVAGNPVMLIDPDGMEWSESNKYLADQYGLFGNGGEGWEYNTWGERKETEDPLTAILLVNQAIDEKSEELWKNSFDQGHMVVKEHGLIIVEKNGKIYWKNVVSGEAGKLKFDYTLEEGETLLGTLHTHPYSVLQGSLLGVAHSEGDINSLRGHIKENFVMMVESGSGRYALVITDVEKATKFFNENNKNDIFKTYREINNNEGVGKPYQRSRAAVIETICNNNGIDFYRSNKSKGNFIKLND